VLLNVQGHMAVSPKNGEMAIYEIIWHKQLKKSSDMTVKILHALIKTLYGVLHQIAIRSNYLPSFSVGALCIKKTGRVKLLTLPA